MKNDSGDEVYARDRHGNEFYPRNGDRILARDKLGREYYARDKNGNQVYPLKRRRSVTIHREDGDPVVAVTREGAQRYPVDDKGNEYYLRRDDGTPVVLKNEAGEPYFARTRNGREMIPWNTLNHLDPDETPLITYRDKNGNTVYVKMNNKSYEGVFKCLCEMLIFCPAAAAAATSIIPLMC